MNNNDPTFNPDQTAALRRTRIYWAAALLINLPLPFIALPITGSDWISQQPGNAAKNAMLLALVIGAGSLVLGLFARNQIYKANWSADVITPAGYVKANTAFFIAATLGALGLFVLSVVTNYPAPTFAAAPIVIGLILFNFPNGKPMLPAPPRIGNDGDRL